MVEKIAEIRKALAAFLVPALVALGVALVDGVISAEEWVHIAIAALGTGAVVYAVPNKDSEGGVG